MAMQQFVFDEATDEKRLLAMRPIAFVVVCKKWHVQGHRLDLGSAVPWARLWIRQSAQTYGRSTKAGRWRSSQDQRWGKPQRLVDCGLSANGTDLRDQGGRGSTRRSEVTEVSLAWRKLFLLAHSLTYSDDSYTSLNRTPFEFKNGLHHHNLSFFG